MYQIAKLTACLADLLGFRQEQNPNFKALPADLVTPKSGQFYNDIHPLITLENIRAIAPDFSEYQYPAYVAETEYSKTDRVTIGAISYESIADQNAGNAPASSPQSWKEVNHLADFLRQTVAGSITNLAQEISLRGKLDGTTKTVIEDLVLYSGGGTLTDLVIKTGRFVGLKIQVKTKTDVAVILQAVGTQFTQTNEGLKLYLYQDKKAEPLAVLPLPLSGAGGFEWTPLTEQYLDTVTEGVYYLGYYENDLLGQAVRKEYDFVLGPCSSCNQYNLESWQQWSKHIEITPFSVAPEDLNEDLTQWQASALNTLEKTNFGLNLRLSVICEPTGFLCRNKGILAKALGLQVAADLLAKMAFSQRVNGLAQEIKQAAFVELNNKNNNQPGVYTNLNRAITGLQFDLSGFNSICLPCKENDTIDWSAF